MKYPAMMMAHTPSGPTPVCEEHAKKIKALMNFMGCHVNFTHLEEPTECTNCVNENKTKN